MFITDSMVRERFPVPFLGLLMNRENNLDEALGPLRASPEGCSKASRPPLCFLNYYKTICNHLTLLMWD